MQIFNRENLTDGQCLSPCICKGCNAFLQMKNFDGVNFD